MINFSNKKPAGAAPQFKKPAARRLQFKPAIAQLKNAMSAQSVKRPVAPPVYRPQATPKAAQPKMSHDAVNRKPPAAPPVYRPQPTPKVLQTKKSLIQSPQANQTRRDPVAPPVYRPEAKKIVQPKAMLPIPTLQRMTRGTPPATSTAPAKGAPVNAQAMSRSAAGRLPKVLQTKSCSAVRPHSRCGGATVPGMPAAGAGFQSSTSNRKSQNRSHLSNSGVIQGIFTYNRKRIREITPVIVSLFQGSEGFLRTLTDYQARHHDHRESFDLMQWFYAEIERRGWNDHDVTQKGELRISLSQFIGKVIDGDYDDAQQPAPHLMPDSSSRGHIEPKRPERVKICFILEDDANLGDAILLRLAFHQFKTFRKQVKNSFQNQTLSRLKHLPKSDRPKILFEDYQEHLSFFDNELVSLQNTFPFKTGVLVLLKDQDRDGFIPVVNGRRQPVAVITYGDATFLPNLVRANEITAESRTVFTKLGKSGKEYVADNRGVPTGRYVYVEKNYYQFMQFLSTLTMEGRYQLFHKAVGLRPDLFSPGSGHAAKQIFNQVPNQLSLSQLAVMHQMMGNGPQQRGLSLTCTSRVGAVFSNEGEPFREYDGVRIKIDLAKVPKSVILLNHYASGGTVDDLDSVKPEIRGGRDKSKYDYSGSVKKNREIFLERLQVDWIESIDLHLSGRTVSLSACHNRDIPLQEMRRVFGHQDYVEGVRAALEPKSSVASDLTKMSENFQRGFRSGQLYLAGYEAGLKAKAKLKKKDDSPFTTVAGKFMEDEKAKKLLGQKRFPDIYWLGWGHGYRNLKHDPLAVLQSQHPSPVSSPVSYSMSTNYSMSGQHSMSSSASNNNNNNNASASSSPPPKHGPSAMHQPAREIPVQDPSSFLAPQQNVWAANSIGKVFRGADGNNYKLTRYTKENGTFYFQRQ